MSPPVAALALLGLSAASPMQAVVLDFFERHAAP